MNKTTASSADKAEVYYSDLEKRKCDKPPAVCPKCEYVSTHCRCKKEPADAETCLEFGERILAAENSPRKPENRTSSRNIGLRILEFTSDGVQRDCLLLRDFVLDERSIAPFLEAIKTELRAWITPGNDPTFLRGDSDE